MSFDDEIARILRYFRKRFEEMEALALSMLGYSPLREHPAPDLSYTLDRLRDGILEPLVSILDEGEHLVVAISLPGASRDTINIRVYPDRIYVEAALHKEAIERALGTLHWSRYVRMYRSTIRLPTLVDPSTAVTTTRGDIIIIKLRKAAAQQP